MNLSDKSLNDLTIDFIDELIKLYNNKEYLIIKKIIYPFLIVSQTVPFITLAPLLTLWFGFGLLPKIIIIILV